MTNYEKIKNMSVEEMAKQISVFVNKICSMSDCDDCPCKIIGLCIANNTALQWLNNLGFSYNQLEQYIVEGTCGDSEVDDKINLLHQKNKFKLELMPSFKPNK